MLNKSFSAKLQKSPNKGGWTYVVWPGSVKFFGTKGLVKISGTIDGHPFRGFFMAMGEGRHMLPVKAEIRKVIGKDVGQTKEKVDLFCVTEYQYGGFRSVKVLLEERL
jgi:hypothetical protein